jgi:prepilin-type N-terminal cleavage/methylation domain-containing protein
MPSRKPKDGFTIIEVMIVLAIAGVILLIVFLAVPAVQRNTRNVERKNAAAFISAQRQQYDIDNATALLDGADECPTTDPNFTAFCDNILAGLSYYTNTGVYIIDNGYTVPTCIPSPTATCPTYPLLGTIPEITTENVITETYLVCNSTQTAATTTGAQPSDMVVLFALETATGQINECLQSSVF